MDYIKHKSNTSYRYAEIDLIAFDWEQTTSKRKKLPTNVFCDIFLI